MKKSLHIPIHDAPTFLNRHMQPPPANMLKSNFGDFFIVKVQDMVRLMKLPVPPTKSMAHTCIYLTDGRARMTIGTQSYSIKKNEMLFVPAGSIFSFDQYDLNKGYLLHFKNVFLPAGFKHQSYGFIQPWGNPYLKPNPQSSAAIHHLCKRIYAEYQQNGIAKTDLIQPYLVALLAEANRVYQPAPAKGAPSAITISQKFRSLVFTHIQHMHRVSDYAQKLNISPNHLNKCVKSVTGQSPTRWIDEAIVLEAKALLHQSDLTITEVAATVGHNDPSYFTRLFKKHTGKTPVQFRKMIEKS